MIFAMKIRFSGGLIYKAILGDYIRNLDIFDICSINIKVFCYLVIFLYEYQGCEFYIYQL